MFLVGNYGSMLFSCGHHTLDLQNMYVGCDAYTCVMTDQCDEECRVLPSVTHHHYLLLLDPYCNGLYSLFQYNITFRLEGKFYSTNRVNVSITQTILHAW